MRTGGRPHCARPSRDAPPSAHSPASVFVGAGRAHWRPRFGGDVRTDRRPHCAQPTRNDPSSAHGPTAPLPALRTAPPETAPPVCTAPAVYTADLVLTGGMRTRPSVVPGCVHWRCRFDGGMRTGRRPHCAQLTRNDPSSAHGPQSARARAGWEESLALAGPAHAPDSRALASRAPPEQNRRRSREAAIRAPSTRESAGSNHSSRVLGKWLRFCKTPAQDKTFQTSQAHVN